MEAERTRDPPIGMTIAAALRCARQFDALVKGAGMRVLAQRAGVATSVIVWTMILALPASADPPDVKATPENMQKLSGLLSKGYGPQDCQPTALVGNQVAALDCGLNTEADVLFGVTYALYTDAASLHSAFTDLIGRYHLVTCPGLDPSPTSWHYRDAPDSTAGSLACGDDDPLSEVVWTDDANLMLGSADSLDYVAPLYEWWRTGS
jgi:hypothetical protein